MAMTMEGSTKSRCLDSLQGWWENSHLKKHGMHHVKGSRVFINHKAIKDTLKVGSKDKLTFGRYSGVVENDGKDRRISWNHGQIVWTYIGELPDTYDPDTKGGRFKYTTLLGKGAHGVVVEAVDMDANADPPKQHVAVKVMRHSTGYPQLMGKRVARMHCEYLWSHMLLHNSKHEHYMHEQGCFFLKYLEDHTGLPPASEAELLAPDLLEKLERMKGVARLPYVVMELARGDTLWRSLYETQGEESIPITMNEKREIVQQLVCGLAYLRKFNLLHRDLRFHNLFFSRNEGRVEVKIGDFGMMSLHTQTLLLARSPEEGWTSRDWIPWEVWRVPKACEKNAQALDFEMQSEPPKDLEDKWQAFDVFSLGVIHLYLCLGQADARQILERVRAESNEPALQCQNRRHLILDPSVTLQMVSKIPKERPTPQEIVASLPPRKLRALAGRSRSRSRGTGFRSNETASTTAGDYGDASPHLGKPRASGSKSVRAFEACGGALR